MNDPAFSLGFFCFSFGVVVLTSLWIAVDASVNKIPTGGVDYDSGSGGAVTWFIACILMWIIVFPWYFIKKSSVLRIRSEQRAREAKREARQQAVQAATAELQDRVRDLEARVGELQFDLASLLRLLQSKNLLTPTEMALLIAKRVLPGSNLHGVPSFQDEHEATAIQAAATERKK